MDKWLGEHEQRIGEIYGELVKLRDTMAKKLGYKSFIELGYYNLGRTDYNADMVKVYREQIAKEVVPVCNKLYKQQMTPDCFIDKSIIDKSYSNKDWHEMFVGKIVSVLKKS